MEPPEFGGLGPDETPWVKFTWRVGEWQWVNYGDQATISYTTTPSGKDPALGSAGGQFTVQDAGTTTRNTVAGGDFEIDCSGWWTLQPIRDHNYSNSIGGWKKVRGGSGPIIRAKGYWTNLADMPGLYSDSTGTKTAKQCLLQFGKVAQGTFAAYMQRAFLTGLDPSKRVDLEQSTALQLEFVADTGRQTALSSDALKLEDAALVLGFM